MVSFKPDKNRFILIKLLLIGAVIQPLSLIFDRLLGIVNPQDRILVLIWATIDWFLLVPILLFLLAFIAYRKYVTYIQYKHKVITVAAYIFLGWFIAFTIFEIINQKSFVFYNPSLLKMVAPFLGAYLASRLNKKSHAQKKIIKSEAEGPARGGQAS